MKGYHIYWTSNTIYVDIETGEIIDKYKIKKKEYIIIKKISKTTDNEDKSKRHTEHCYKCRRNQQGKLNFSI